MYKGQLSLNQRQLISTNNINFPRIKPKEKGLNSDLICSKSAISSVLNCNFYAWTQSVCGIDVQKVLQHLFFYKCQVLH